MYPNKSGEDYDISEFSNITDLLRNYSALDNLQVNGHDGISKVLAGFLVLLYFFTMLISVGGNAVVCYTIFALQNLRRTVTNLYIANLAVSDILMSIFCIPFTVLSNIVFSYWPFGDSLCPMINYLQLAVVLQRAFSLTALVYDQHNITRRNFVTDRSKLRAKVIILLLWMVALMVSIPHAMFSKLEYIPTETGLKGFCTEKWSADNEKVWYSAIIMVLQYFLPLILIIIIYSRIGVFILSRRTPGEANIIRDLRLTKSKYKTLKMFLAVVVIYAVSWLPLHILTLIGDKDPSIYDKEFVHIAWLISHWLSSSNAGTSPIIYGWRNSSFRLGYKLIVNKLFCREIFIISPFQMIQPSLQLHLRNLTKKSQGQRTRYKLTNL